MAKAIDVQRVIQAAVGRWGRIDILVNNAAMMTFDPITDLSEEDWDVVLAVNLKAPFLFSKFALPHMQDRAAIVNVSSVHAAATTRTVVPYASAKGGLEAFTRALAVELRDRGIRVNALRLGAIDTPMLWNNPNVKSGAEKIDPADVGNPTGSWRNAKAMPVVRLPAIGLAPFLQWVVLPLLLVWFVKRQLGGGIPSRR